MVDPIFDKVRDKVKVLGAFRELEARGAFCTRKPTLHGPFNRNISRQVQYVDNVLPEWQGRLEVLPDDALEGPDSILFDGVDQGVFPGDTRPIRTEDGFCWNTPGFHFLRLRAATEDGIRRVVAVRRGGEAEIVSGEKNQRALETTLSLEPLETDDYLYLRLDTVHGEMAWASPVWGDAPAKA